MKTVIAPTDFTQTSLHAVDYAADLASSIQANLLLVHIIEIPLTMEPMVMDNYANDLDEANKDISALQEKIKARVGNSIQVDTYVGTGILLHELENVCDKYQPLLIVMGTGERGPVEKMFIGNSTNMAVQTLSAPVLVVPHDTTFKSINKICLACDLEDIYQLPLKRVTELVTLFHATLDIVHVCKNEKEKSRSFVPAELVKENLKALHPEVHFIIYKDANAAVKDYAQRQADDILLVIPKKKSFIESLFMRSHTEVLSENEEIPILSVSR